MKIFINRELAFEKFANMLPEIVYEIDISGKITYSNQQGLEFFGYEKEDLARGVSISEVFPDSYQKMAENLKSLKLQGHISSNEYIARKRDGTEVPVVTHTFATFLNGNSYWIQGCIV